MGYSVFGASNSLQIIYYRRCKACKKNFCVNIDNIRSHTYTQVILFFFQHSDRIRINFIDNQTVRKFKLPNESTLDQILNGFMIKLNCVLSKPIYIVLQNRADFFSIF